MRYNLVIQIYVNKSHKKPIATIGYRSYWEEFTFSSLIELNRLYESYKTYKEQGLSDVSSIYCAVTDNSGGFEDDDEIEALELYPELHQYYNPDKPIFHTSGLLALTEGKQQYLMTIHNSDVKLFLEEGSFIFKTLDIAKITDEDFMDDHGYLFYKWLNKAKGSTVAPKEIATYCEQQFPEFDYSQHYLIRDIDALKETFQKNSYFYNKKNKEFICAIS